MLGKTFAVLAASLVLVVGSAAWGRGTTVNLLAIGNSFSNDALTYLDSLAKATGNTLVVGHAMIGGCDFERHLRHADAHEKDPADPAGQPYAGKKSLKDLLTQEAWEVVTIQQVSSKSFKPETFHPHADRLIERVRRHAPQAEIVIHQTWAYRDDHGFFGQPDLNPDAMYRGLRAAYDALAQQYSLRQIPSGDAMEAARRDPAWGRFVPDPDFDPAKAVRPELPKERRSLHGGYGWRRDRKTGEYRLGNDAIHANRHGDYLLGCVWFEFLFRQSAVGIGFIPEGIDAADAAVLQRLAHRVVSEGQRPELAP